MNIHVPRPNSGPGRRWRFKANDRIRIDASYYVHVRSEAGRHVFQRVIDGSIEDFARAFSDEEITQKVKSRTLQVEEGFFSRARNELRFRIQSGVLDDLRPDQARTVLWKAEWISRFLKAHCDSTGEWSPRFRNEDMQIFIEENREAVHRWYIEKIGEPRPPGRAYKDRERKTFDWPSASALRKWMNDFESGECRLEALAPQTDRCGNRHQLSPIVAEIVDQHVKRYCALEQPTMEHIYMDVACDLDRRNRSAIAKAPADADRKLPQKMKVSRSAVRRRIRKTAPYIRELGRFGRDAARMRYAGSGKGLTATRPLQYVMLDDWEADLFALMRQSKVLRHMSKKERSLIPRVRLNVTVAIDICTRCVVGLAVAPVSPSSTTTSTAIRTILSDKTEIAAWAGAESEWDMYGPFTRLITDGGPAMRGKVEDVLRGIGMGHSIPEKNPRKRGHVESFFKGLRQVCAYFAGRSFSNVVERGDYPSELYASLTVEEFHKALIRWIVDIYHQRPHSGLRGLTPYEAWLRECSRSPGFADTPSPETLAVAFGIRREATLDQAGVRVMNLRYWSEELSRLDRMIGGGKVKVRVDPFDVTTAYVLIPKEHRHPAIFGSRHYLAAPCMNLDEGETMMAQVISRYRLERIEAQSAEEDGLATRMAAHRDLYDLGNVSAARLHIPLGGATPDQIQRAIDEIERSERASAGKVNHAAEAMDMSEDAIGFLVTTDESVQPDAPASTDQLINFAADPEEGVPATIEKPSSPIRRAKPAANRKPHSPKGRPPRQRWTNMIGENDE